MRNTVTNTEVAEFKTKWCDENETIAEIIRRDLRKFFLPVVLDVGAGTGDIAAKAFPDKEAILVDINDFPARRYPISPKHKRIQCNFFDFAGHGNISTIFISHTLQFLDADLPKLNKKLSEISPQNIILVTNSNDDVMGDIINWCTLHLSYSHPEIKQQRFPEGYALAEAIPFKASLVCPNLDVLATQVSYLMLTQTTDDDLQRLKAFLKETLGNQTGFQFNQTIETYSKK